MPPLKRLISNGFVYHTISVTRWRQHIFNDPPTVDVLLQNIQFVRSSRAAYILTYAVIPDHLHLLLVPSNGATVSSVMKTIKGYTAKDLNRVTGHNGAVWQQSFYDRVIRGDEHLRLTVDYIHRNPVKAGLVPDAEANAWSSAHKDALTDLESFLSG
jgi:REP-associated tyrosine transposase